MEVFRFEEKEEPPLHDLRVVDLVANGRVVALGAPRQIPVHGTVADITISMGDKDHGVVLCVNCTGMWLEGGPVPSVCKPYKLKAKP